MADTMGQAVDRTGYWNEFYAREGARIAIPSQFAVFTAVEIQGTPFVVDIGCGSGRDALFFASRGFRVLGVDASEAAVEGCRGASEQAGLNAQFLASSISASDLQQRISDVRGSEIGGAGTVVYARFFVHAITEEEEDAFLKLAAGVCAGGGKLAVEYRTLRDKSLEKVTATHYRRFVDPLKFMEKAHRLGFNSEYFVEGFGYAKYRGDDAHVARSLMRFA